MSRAIVNRVLSSRCHLIIHIRQLTIAAHVRRLNKNIRNQTVTSTKSYTKLVIYHSSFDYILVQNQAIARRKCPSEPRYQSLLDAEASMSVSLPVTLDSWLFGIFDPDTV